MKTTKLILLAALAGAVTVSADAGVRFSIGLPVPVVVTAPVVVTPVPAPLVETVPVCPGVDYVWTPGYWAWRGHSYAWVRGTWTYHHGYTPVNRFHDRDGRGHEGHGFDRHDNYRR